MFEQVFRAHIQYSDKKGTQRKQTGTYSELPQKEGRVCYKNPVQGFGFRGPLRDFLSVPLKGPESNL